VKTISVRELQQKIRAVMETAQKDQVVITRNGRPVAVILGIEGADWETVAQETSKSFWKEIGKRRKQKTISLSEMRKRLGT
jgi:prevent-host-death family protein